MHKVTSTYIRISSTITEYTRVHYGFGCHTLTILRTYPNFIYILAVRERRNFNRALNKRMKVIEKALGLPASSTNVARHSYATVLKRSGASIAYISESMGHHNLKTTEIYLDSFETEERKKNASLLAQFDTDIPPTAAT